MRISLLFVMIFYDLRFRRFLSIVRYFIVCLFPLLQCVLQNLLFRYSDALVKFLFTFSFHFFVLLFVAFSLVSECSDCVSIFFFSRMDFVRLRK